MPRPICFKRDADGYLPIEGYGAIGNGRTVALVGADGSIDWCPFPRIDQPSVFARILDAHVGGYWQIVPDEPWTATRRYLDDTNILVTTYTTENGVVDLVDLMPSIAFGSDLGLSNRLWDGMLLRRVLGVRGTVTMRQEIRPGFNYGREQTRVELIPGRGVVLSGDSVALRVTYPAEMSAVDGGAVATWTVSEGDEGFTSASYHGLGAVVWADLPDRLARDLYEREVEGWQRWMTRCTYDGPYREFVRRSALALKLLDHLPSGAMAAAATTSLPEDLGGVRNWDYRYAWIRDTSFAIHALSAIGFRDEAEGFLQWVIDATNNDPTSLQIMYRVDGDSKLNEIELEHLEGYKGARPVRVGNGAHSQVQLDRFGEIVDAAWAHRRFGGAVNGALWQYITEVVELIIERWRRVDSGIWEVRSEPRRMTYSNVMCWVGVARAIQLAKIDDRAAPLDRWRAVRNEMHDEIMRLGVTVDGYFSQGFGDDILDAAALAFPTRSFIKVDHPVMRRTIEAVERELTQDGLVGRYVVHKDRDNVDGLPGDEGHFLLCSCWLIDCLTGLGETDRATKLLEKLLDRANDLGLYAEEVDADDGAFLGNFPQAFSHVGLINAIVNLARSQGDRARAPDDDYGDISGAMRAGGRHDSK
ncbi:MAG TPA: glycoside hydrolase family 15 protein [Thermomicrobiales bacterium]|nr:glycoside hydrolase family 15 protein [Thermomicrobiales bacterium]